MMTRKLKIAVSWAGACGGCDVAILDSGEGLLRLLEVAEPVYWPVAFDHKREALEALDPGAVDVAVFNGCIRTAEHAADARLLREKARVLVAFGACAAFGGIPGLANLAGRDELLDRVYRDTPSTANPEDVRPRCRTGEGGRTLHLPELEAVVNPVDRVVPVDIVVPGCPPAETQVEALLEIVHALAGGGDPPPAGTVLAGERALCDVCPRRDTRTARLMGRPRRTHVVAADPGLCFLEQGILCLGLATRGGCGATCIGANMPCRGCFGPTAEMLDPAAEALSATGALASEPHEDDLIPGHRLAPVRAIPDLAGTFYRFTLPTATVFRGVADRREE